MYGDEADLGYIHCCSGLRKAKTFSILPEEGYSMAQVDYLEECPVCGHSIIQLTRIDFDNNVSICRKVNEKARRFFNKLKNLIRYEKKSNEPNFMYHSKFYLQYNEFGVKKKCYSNLSTLKMGLFENKNLEIHKNIKDRLPLNSPQKSFTQKLS